MEETSRDARPEEDEDDSDLVPKTFLQKHGFKLFLAGVAVASGIFGYLSGD